MKQTVQLTDALKQALRAHKKTYADVAQMLDLSEGSVKRLFAGNGFTMERFEKVCAMINMDITDIVQLMNERSVNLKQLTWEQESEIANDLTLLLVAICALNRWTVEDVLENYKLTETQVIHHLATLDGMKLIELLPGNRIKILASPNFKWIENGPIQKFFKEKVGKDVFNSRFDRQTEKLVVVSAMLTKKSNAVLQKKLDKLMIEMDQLNNEDAGLPVKEKIGTTLVMAIREWNYGVFAGLRK